jgi:PPOX class probable F420-dependent enzyme
MGARRGSLEPALHGVPRRERESIMPRGSVPERFRDLLDSKTLGHLATIGANGRPQVNPVWFLADQQFVYLSIKPETAKYRNLRANPAVAMSVGDLARPDRYLEVRGEAVEFELYETLDWVNQLAHKYTGAEFTGGADGEPRYKVTIRIDAWTGQD